MYDDRNDAIHDILQHVCPFSIYAISYKSNKFTTMYPLNDSLAKYWDAVRVDELVAVLKDES